MIAAVIALATVTVALAGVLAYLVRSQAAERREWVDERRALVDRAIAQHTGEILALDRQQRPKEEHHGERPVAVGL